MTELAEINDVASLVKTVKEINSHLKGQIWWRGQSDFTWKLNPSVFRSELNGYDEKSGIRRFMQKAQSRHVSVPSISNKQDWLFLMQHYGLPTRLLDWTESPLIACFFAIGHNYKDTDGALYALSPYKLNESQTEMSKLLMPYDAPAVEIIDSIFNVGKENVQRIIAIRPGEVDMRLLTQLSVFTLHGHSQLLDEISNSQDFLIKIKIPMNTKKKLRKQLKQLGIRESNIFPDLDHLAKEIKSTRFRKTDLPNLPLEGNGISVSGESTS